MTQKKDTLTWDESISVEDYFRKAFQLGKEHHPFVVKLKRFFPETYERVKREFNE